MNVLSLLAVIVVTVIFYFLVELVRHFSGLPRNLFDYNRDIKQTKKSLKLPKIEGEKVFLGKRGRKEISLPTDISHAFVCGTTGSGKTVALANFVKTAVEYEYPLLVVDGKGDTGKGSLLDIINQLKGDRKLYVIDLNHPESSDKYNPFYKTSPTIIKDMLINMTNWSEEHYKMNMERYLQRIITMLFIADILLSFKNIVEYINPDKFLLLSASLVKDKRLDKEEHLKNVELAKSSGKTVEGAVARFATILESDIGCIFSDEGIDIYSALKEKAIILFILNPLLYPELSPHFGKLVVIDSKKAVSKFYGENLMRSFFLFDEINVYASKAFLDLVNKSRSANITCVLASQSLSDLEASEDESFKQQVIENCNNYLILRQNSPKNAEEWSNVVGTRNAMEVTYQLTKEDGFTTASGNGSLKKTKEYIIHPDTIKYLGKGEAYLVSKDIGLKTELSIHKPF